MNAKKQILITVVLLLSQIAVISAQRNKNYFQAKLLKVEVNYDQFFSGDTLEVVCTWQNEGNSPSAQPLSGMLELSFGHQRIVETTPKFHRYYFDIYPATTQWQKGEIWKTSIRQKIPPYWGGSYRLNIGLCDENHLPVAFTAENGRKVYFVTPGQIELGWGLGKPTMERMRKPFSKEYNSMVEFKKDENVSYTYLAIGDNRMIRLSDKKPVLLGVGSVINSTQSGDNSPVISVRNFEKDELIYSSSSELTVKYNVIAKNDKSVVYKASVLNKKQEVARFDLVFETIERKLQIRLKNVYEGKGFELIDIKLPSLLSLSGNDVSMMNFFGGGRLISLKEALPEGYVMKYDTRNAAALLTKSEQIILESTCLDDKLIQSVHENASARTANMGMILVNKVLGKGKIASIPVESDHCITIDLLDESWGKPDWQNVAKFLRKDLKGKNRDLYRNALFFKTLATSGPQPPKGYVKEGDPFFVRRLETVIPFNKIKDLTRQYYNIFDGIKQINYIPGFLEGGFDNNYPHVFNTDQRAGTVEELKACIKDGKKYNAIVSLHDNYDSNVPGGDYYDERITAIDSYGKPWLGWIWAGGIDHIVAPYKYKQLGLMQERVKKTVDLYGIQTTYHLDVLTSEVLIYDFDPNFPASADKSIKAKLAIVHEFNKYGIDLTCESLSHPFVGHVGHTLGHRYNRETSLFKGDRYIPLIPFVYHGTIGYCSFPVNEGTKQINDDRVLSGMINGARVFPTEEGFTPDDIKAIYIQHLPIDVFYDKKMDRIEKFNDTTKVVYDATSYVAVNFKKRTYEIVNDGIIVGKDWTTFVKGTKPDTWLAYSIKGGDMVYDAPMGWTEKTRLKANTLSFEGIGNEVPFTIDGGKIKLVMPAQTPVKISIQR
jgi:hypothetical protein